MEIYRNNNVQTREDIDFSKWRVNYLKEEGADLGDSLETSDLTASQHRILQALF